MYAMVYFPFVGSEKVVLGFLTLTLTPDTLSVAAPAALVVDFMEIVIESPSLIEVGSVVGVCVNVPPVFDGVKVTDSKSAFAVS